MLFHFDIRKATASAAYVCGLNGGSLNVLHLIKMLYWADRTALQSWHRTITGDRFVSMRNGPVLSRIYNLIQGRGGGPEMAVWSGTFHARSGNTVSLKSEPDLDPLSPRETDALRTAFEKFRHVPAGDLIEFLHKVLPEWTDPGDSSVPIEPETILRAAGFDDKQIAEIGVGADFSSAARRALQVA